jgi:hypothetical protein
MTSSASDLTLGWFCFPGVFPLHARFPGIKWMKNMKHMSRFDFTALAIFVCLSIALAVIAFSFGGMDFGVYYAAAKVTMQGGNPYDYQQLAPEIISSTDRLNNPYYYAPWFTWMVVPLGFFPFEIARILWAVLNFILWLWSLYNLSNLVDYPRQGWRRWGVWLLVTFVFAWSTWGVEQVGILILFLFTLILLYIQRGNWLATGICLALILFKPNISALPAGMIALWLLLRLKIWQPALYMIGTLGGMAVVSLLVTPGWFMDIFEADKIQGLSHTLDETGGANVARYTTTLTDWLAVYGVEGSTSVWIHGLAVIGGALALWFGLRRSETVIEFSALAILINFMVIPYALFYDYPLLTIALFYGNYVLCRHPSWSWARYAANTLIVSVLFVGDVIPYRYWITVILLLLISIGYLPRFFRTPSR